jgi:hypothetical protein
MIRIQGRAEAGPRTEKGKMREQEFPRPRGPATNPSVCLKQTGQHMKTGYHMWIHDVENLATVSPLVCK